MSPRAVVLLALAGFAVALTISLAAGSGADGQPAIAARFTTGPPLRPQSSLIAPRGAVAAAARRGVRNYRGVGAWVDQYDSVIFNDPWPALAEMRRRGVRT